MSIFGVGCGECVKSGDCKRPCKRPNEFWGVAQDTGPGIEIVVSEIAAKAWIVTVTKKTADGLKRVYQTSRIFRSTSADGVAHRLQKRRFPNAKVQFFNSPAYNESAL
jgi:hypothetical protein